MASRNGNGSNGTTINLNNGSGAQGNPALTQYRYSVKLESTAKGYIMPTVHVYSDDLKEIENVPVALLAHICAVVKQGGFKLATDIAEPEGGQKQ